MEEIIEFELRGPWPPGREIVHVPFNWLFSWQNKNL